MLKENIFNYIFQHWKIILYCCFLFFLMKIIKIGQEKEDLKSSLIYLVFKSVNFFKKWNVDYVDLFC